jgi:tight adherence protein B
MVYRQRMLADVGRALQSQFIEASPAALLLASSALATIMAGLAAVLLSPTLAPVFALAGLAAPRAALALVRARRIRMFVQQMPDAMQSMASSLRAGANLSKALELMATRQPVPLSEEFSLLIAKQRLGHDIGESLGDLRRRVPASEVDLFNSAVLISRRVGGNLADTLESLAATLREKAQVEGKINSLTAMGRLQGWVLCLLPALVGGVLYLQQPDRMSRLFTDWFGWAVLAAVAAMMTLAVWMIRRIVNIDV